MTKPPDLEIDENMVFQGTEWAVELLGVVGMIAVVVAMAQGVFGLSEKTVTEAGQGPLAARYDRVVHWETQTTLELRIKPSAPDHRASVSINDAYLDAMMTERITPEPERVESGADRTTFTFAGSDGGQALVVRFYLEPDRPGDVDADIRLADGASVQFEQQVLP